MVLVGPNNAGKSVGLRDIENHLAAGPDPTVVTHAVPKLTGRRKTRIPKSFLLANSNFDDSLSNPAYTGYGFRIPIQILDRIWPNNPQFVKDIFCVRLATESRITDSNPAPNFAALRQAPSHPIHLLYLDDHLEKRLSNYFRQAFGEHLVVYNSGGNEIPLLVGDRPQYVGIENRTTTFLQPKAPICNSPFTSAG